MTHPDDRGEALIVNEPASALGDPTRVDPAEPWRLVQAAFSAAIDLSEPARAAYLASIVDPTLREEVAALLASDQAAGSFIEHPAALMLGAQSTADGSVRRLSVGMRLGAYQITSSLGAGGMSEVYLARDTRLDRLVAIKVVRNDRDDARARARLLKEAQHASTLNHPHICTVHEVDEVDGLPFIVMEYVEGRALSELIREGLTPADVLRYGAQIAEGLAHAHGHGLIHRDLKGSNVVIAVDGRAKVLDFGLSKRLPAHAELTSSSSSLVENPTLAGTLSHMAPEALVGRSVDARSDVWALGVLLFEMASGDLPFKGETMFELSAAILNEPPRPLPPRVALGLRMVVERCLAKNPADRFTHAGDVRTALEALRSRAALPVISRLIVQRHWRMMGAAVLAALVIVVAVSTLGSWWSRFFSRGPTVRTLAVLPLEDASSDRTDSYFVDGFTDGLIATLGQVTELRVISRGSAMKYRGTSKSSQEIARELKADALVQGSVRRTGDRVRLMLRLVDAPTGRVVWTEARERSARDVLALQADGVQAIAAGVRISLSDMLRGQIGTVRAVDPDVYEAYLKGRFYWNQRTTASLERAVGHFQTALDLDPTYAPAYTAMADCYNQLGTQMLGSGSPRQWRPLATTAAVRALQIDPRMPEAHATLGYVKHYNWEWDEAEKAFKRAIELNPSYALAHMWYANLLMGRRRFDESVQQVSIAQELDPLSLVVNTNVGWVLTAAGRHEQAIAQLQRTVRMDPAYPQAHWRLGRAYAAIGRFDEAIEELQMLVRLTEKDPVSLTGLAQVYAQAGRLAPAHRLLQDVLRAANHQYVPPGAIANVYMALGDADHAIESLEKAFEERSNRIAYLAADPPHALRDDERFHRLLRRAGLE